MTKTNENWMSDYKEKLISADEAAKLVKSGDSVTFTSGREAFAIGLALAARKEELKGVKVFAPTPTFDFGWYDAGWEDSFEIMIRMPTGTCQEAVDDHRLDINPGTLIPFMDVEAGDVLLTEVSPPDDKGFCSFGASLWAKKRQVRESKLVIAEVNEKLVRTYGDNYIHISELDYLVEHLSTGIVPGSGSLAGRAIKEPEPYLKDIAGYVSELIRDGDTLQIGVGRTTEPLINLGIIDNKQDIGWHSEATPPGIINRIKSGLINGKRKTINTGIAVVTSIGGSSAEEMIWISENPLVHLVDVSYLEDIKVISAHDNYVAINNALILDLTGQIGAQTIGTREMAGAGGQIPFVFGSWLSKNGRSITVLPSTARNGTVSRINPLLPEGTIVTIQRNCADCIVTEYGIARLKGKSIRNRVITDALDGSIWSVRTDGLCYDYRPWAMARMVAAAHLSRSQTTDRLNASPPPSQADTMTKRFRQLSESIVLECQGVKASQLMDPDSSQPSVRWIYDLVLRNYRDEPASGTLMFDNLPEQLTALTGSVKVSKLDWAYPLQTRLTAVSDSALVNAFGSSVQNVTFQSTDGRRVTAICRISAAGAPRVDYPIRIDATFDDWPQPKASVAGDFWRIIPDGPQAVMFATPASRRAKRQTSVQLGHDDEYLYFAFTCYQPSQAMRTRRSNDVDRMCGLAWGEDMVAVLIDPDNRRSLYPQDAYHITVKANGAVICTRGLPGDRRGSGVSWSTKAHAAVKVFDDRWHVELAVPLADVDGGDKLDRWWGMDFVRVSAASGEFSSWSAARSQVYTPISFGNVFVSR